MQKTKFSIQKSTYTPIPDKMRNKEDLEQMIKLMENFEKEHKCKAYFMYCPFGLAGKIIGIKRGTYNILYRGIAPTIDISHKDTQRVFIITNRKTSFSLCSPWLRAIR